MGRFGIYFKSNTCCPETTTRNETLGLGERSLQSDRLPKNVPNPDIHEHKKARRTVCKRKVKAENGLQAREGYMRTVDA
jgi:hypothetical protein